MLHHLLTYAEKNGITSETSFTLRKGIKWLIAFDQSGNNPTIISPGEDKAFAPMLCPDAGNKALGKVAHFLAEKAEVVACYVEFDTPDTSVSKHEVFVDLLRRASDEIQAIKPAADGLSNPDNLLEICRQLKKAGAKKSDFVTLRIGDKTLVDIDDWHAWWRAEFRRLRTQPENKPKRKGSQETDKTLMRCLLTGELVSPATSHESTVQGLKRVGGRGGERIISFDKDAYQSYRLKDAHNAASSGETAKAYVTALNSLVSEHAVNLANAMAVYWYKRPLENPQEDVLSWLNASDDSVEHGAMLQARNLFQAIDAGTKPSLLSNEYYAMLISGASARVMMREWSEGSFVGLVQSIKSWFEDIEIVQTTGEGLTKWPTMERAITSLLAPQKPTQRYEDWIKPIGSYSHCFWRAALDHDIALPYALIGRVTPLLASFVIELAEEERKRPAERSPEYYRILVPLLHRRMGLIKAYHLRKGDSHMKPHLNYDHPHPAYHCGRLLAVLARLQRTALGDVGAGVVQRYYAAASQTPGLVLGRLVRNAQNHLSKENVKNPDWFETWLSEITGKIGDAVPPTLTLEQQSLFALGYYQQLAALNAGKSKDKQAEAP